MILIYIYGFRFIDVQIEKIFLLHITLGKANLESAILTQQKSNIKSITYYYVTKEVKRPN